MNEPGQNRTREGVHRLRKAMESSALGGRLEEQHRQLSELLGQVHNAELRRKLAAAFDQQQKTIADLVQAAGTIVAQQQSSLAGARAEFEEAVRVRSLEVDEVDTLDDLSGDEADDDPPREEPFAQVPDATRVAAARAAAAPVEVPEPRSEQMAQAARRVAEQLAVSMQGRRHQDAAADATRATGEAQSADPGPPDAAQAAGPDAQDRA